MVTNKYEAMMVFSVANGDEAVTALVEKFKTLISDNGTLENVDEWGKKRLAYEVQKMREGFYYFIHFEADATAPAEIEARLRIMDNVLRFLCVRQEA